MDRAEAQEFTEGLGQVFTGGFRLIAHAHRQGVPKALGMTTPEWVSQSLGGYVRMAVGERREAVAELTENGMTSVAIADVLGVNEKTVRRDKESANAELEEENLAQTDEWDEEESANAESGEENLAQKAEWDEKESPNDESGDKDEPIVEEAPEPGPHVPNHKLHAAYAEFALRGVELRELLLSGASFGAFAPDNHLAQLQETIQLLRPLLRKKGKAA